MNQAETIIFLAYRAKNDFPKSFNCAECVFEAALKHVKTPLQKNVFKLADQCTHYEVCVEAYREKKGTTAISLIDVPADFHWLSPAVHAVE